MASLDEISNWLEFAGKWRQPVPVINGSKQLQHWLSQHPNSWLLITKNANGYAAINYANCFHSRYQRLQKVMLLCRNSSLANVSR